MALQLKEILPPETTVELRIGTGTVCTVTSSRPNAPGVLLNSNCSVPLVPADETIYCMFVQTDTVTFVCMKSGEPFHDTANPFVGGSLFSLGTLVNQNETSNFWPAVVGIVCESVP